MRGVDELRAQAVRHTMFAETTLRAAVERLGFVQADPIRSPARAQDLILRHRVKGYGAGDLERRYAALDVEEDYVYAYGFVPARVWRLLHPRGQVRLSALERDVLGAVRERGAVHPNELEDRFGKKRVTNAWGGVSKATTRALDHLHHRGLLRVSRRDRGIRVYQAVLDPFEPLPARERLRALVVVVADVLAPVDERTLLGIAARLARWIPGAPAHREAVRALLADGVLARSTVDGASYVWPSARRAAGVVPPRVRFLAPFDPLIWDRRRFEHFYGWCYRFEAYTPVAKRVRGYYAMPLLWRDRVIGWANASVATGDLAVDVGFATSRPRDRDFAREVDAEIERLRVFLG